MFDLEAGGWVKLVNGQTVINGNIRQVTETYITIEGLPPIPLKNWDAIIVKPSPGKTIPMREATNGSNG